MPPPAAAKAAPRCWLPCACSTLIDRGSPPPAIDWRRWKRHGVAQPWSDALGDPLLAIAAPPRLRRRLRLHPSVKQHLCSWLRRRTTWPARKGARAGPSGRPRCAARTPFCNAPQRRTNWPGDGCCRRHRHCRRCRSSFARLPLHLQLLPSCPRRPAGWRRSRALQQQPWQCNPAAASPGGGGPAAKRGAGAFCSCFRLWAATAFSLSHAAAGDQMQPCESLHKDPGASSTTG